MRQRRISSGMEKYSFSRITFEIVGHEMAAQMINRFVITPSPRAFILLSNGGRFTRHCLRDLSVRRFTDVRFGPENRRLELGTQGPARPHASRIRNVARGVFLRLNASGKSNEP